jgi:hypothetical protein
MSVKMYFYASYNIDICWMVEIMKQAKETICLMVFLLRLFQWSDSHNCAEENRRSESSTGPAE